MRIPLASSGLREKDIEKAISVLKSGNLTMGAQVVEFESMMAKYLNRKHFVMVNSGSSANLLMIEALLRPTITKPYLSPGDSILVPAIAWPTTIWPLIQLGLNPLFVDIDPRTLAIDLEAAQFLIDSSRIPVRGIFPIHPLGYSITGTKLKDFADRNELILIEDVCESLGSMDNLNHAGSMGLAASFSFYFSHHITTMEGGGIATDNSQMADDFRSMRSHGWSRDRSDAEYWNEKRHSNDSKFLFVSTGYNVRPMEIQAAIGTQQISDIDDFVQRRRNIAMRVKKSLQGSGMHVIDATDFEGKNERSHSWMLIPIQIDGENVKERRKKILTELQNMEVETRPVLTGNFLSQPAIQRITRHNLEPERYIHASKISETSFLVGAHHDLTFEQIEYLCQSLKKVSVI